MSPSGANRLVSRLTGLSLAVTNATTGAGSVLQHVVANGGNTQPQLFRNAMTDSTFLPSQYPYNHSIPEVSGPPLPVTISLTNETRKSSGTQLLSLTVLEQLTLWVVYETSPLLIYRISTLNSLISISTDYSTGFQ